MKLKHLLVMAAMSVIGGGNSWAQTDVTSTYLVNPSFELKAEGTASTAADLGSNKNADDYYGWTTPKLGTSYSNVSIGNSTTCNGQGVGIPSSASDGSFYFFNRKGWGTQAAELSQTATLPAGKYFITVDYKAYEREVRGGTIGFSINGNSIFTTKPYFATTANSGTWAVNDPWKTVGAWFTVENEGDIKIAITENLDGTKARADLYLDNVKLYKWDLDDEKNYKAATSETPLDVTAKFVTNPYFDNDVAGWTTTTGYQNKGRATNQGGVISGGFFENWNGSAKDSGKMSYTATGLPSGKYRVTMAVFANNETPGLSLFAGEEKAAVATSGFYSVEATTKTGSLDFGIELSTGNTANWLGIDNVRLELIEAINEIDLTSWNDAKAAAETAIAGYDGTNGKPEYEAVVEKKGAADPTSIAQMNEMVTELNKAVAAYTTAADNDKTNADKAGFVSEYNTMKSKYTVTLDTDFKGSCGSASGQHWSGDGRSYADTWSGSATTKANTYTITLPKGEYAFVAAGRGQAGTTPSISVKVGEADATVYNYTAKGDAGYGIATDGSASYDWRNGTFTNNGNGRGWEWGYIEFSLAEEAEVTLSYGYNLFNGSWASISDAALLCTQETKDAAEAAAELAAAKSELESAINSIVVPTANIQGNTENVVAWDKESIDDVNEALEEAKNVLANSNDIDKIKDCIDDVNNLGCLIILQNHNEIPYNIIMAKEGLGWSGNAVTFTYSEGNQNNYAMAYSEVAGESNFNQTVYFGLNAEGDLYMYIIDAAGKKWYVTDGTHVGSTVAWAGSQLRMTDVEEDAMPVRINPSRDKEGVCEIFNDWTGEHIGSTGNNGFYCSNDNYDLSIVEAEKKEITVALKPTSKYGTIILPYECETIPEGAKFYSVSSVNDSKLVLSPETEVKANTPYIVEGEQGASFTFSGYANAFKSSYTTGLLTGVYAETSVPVGSYVMQTKEGVQQFYVVGEGKQPKLATNKAYLTVPTTEAKVLSIGFAEETAIKALDALMSGDAKIYDINGREQKSLQKGVNIVNGVKVMVK